MAKSFFAALGLLVYGAAAFAAPTYIATFHSIGLYWSPQGGGDGKLAAVQFREKGSASWRDGLPLWFDGRNSEYRGSLVELKPGTDYEIKLALEGGASETLAAKTWSEDFRVKRTVQVPAGSTRLVINAADSGSKDEGYVVFTAAHGQNVIDQSGLTGNESCVVVKQGTHHVIIRGLELKNCRRYGVFLERQFEPVLEVQTHDIVIEDNRISGWGGTREKQADVADWDGAVHCNYWRETVDAKRPDRIVIQRNAMFNPRHGANPWRSGSPGSKHPAGAQGVTFERCGSNHVVRYNEIYSTNGNRFMDGLGGGDNFSAAGFPWADSDIYGNRISQAYDDGIEAEGGNRNVRIWGNYLDEVFTAIANASVTVGPLYVWRNVSNRMGGMNNPEVGPDREQRGPFIKGGSNNPTMNGGRAYYFHNTALQPPPSGGARYPMGAGWGISKQAGTMYNFVSRNNIWQIHKEPLINGEPKFFSIRADGDKGPIDADFDLYNGQLANAGRNAERRGFAAKPVYASSEPGNFSLKKNSPGYGAAERIPNFNDRYPRPDVGAHQSGTPPMRFGVEAL
jgi:hypothetical protein